jgi:two-component system, NarL family, nitrate/nitrite response regulator NarL
MGNIRLAIIDAHPMFRVGIAHILTKSGGCEVVAEGAGVEDALRIARQYAPDVLVLDLHADLCGDAIRRIAAECPATRILVLTVLADEDLVIAALQAGAAGYMLKGASGSELVESVQRVHRGEAYVYPALAARLLQGPRGPAKPDAFSTLTIREEQILNHLTRGLSNKEIGRELNLSEKTVKHYVTTLFEKLQVRNRLEAALLAKTRAPNSSRLHLKGNGSE